MYFVTLVPPVTPWCCCYNESETVCLLYKYASHRRIQTFASKGKFKIWVQRLATLCNPFESKGSNPSNVVESGVVKTCFSDHYLVYVTRKFRGSIKANHKVVKSRQMKKFDEDLFISDLAKTDWSAIAYNSDGLDNAVRLWSFHLSSIIEKHASLRERRVTERFSPWITPDLKQLFRTRDKMKVAAVKAKSELLMSAYRQMRCKANNLNSKMKRNYFSNKIQSCAGDTKETWKTINQLVNKRSKTTEILSLKDGEHTISKPQDIAETMNKFFCNVGKDLSENIPNKENPLLNGDYGERETDSTFPFKPITTDEVKKACSKIKNSNGSGTDRISSHFIKVGIEILAPSLAQLFTMSLSVGCFPDNWKTACVAPIFKQGSKDDRSNYRPISVLPVVPRLFEKLVYNQLYDYLDKNKMIFTDQSGFRALHSVLTSLLKCTNDWYLNIDKGKYTAVVYIDLKKAFDTVDHDILLRKLNFCGLKGKELSWFRSYLTDRRQCCKVNGRISATDSITCGVPQGSCLGPLLFLVYINDLPSCLKNSLVSMHADDTSIYYASESVSEINQAVNADLEALKGWLEGNKLSLNVAKTDAMIIGSNGKLRKIDSVDSTKPQFKIGSEDIKLVKEVKYLGVQVDHQLKWTSQLALTTNKISRGIGMLRYAKQYLPLSTVKTMYKSLVEPYFRYCCPVWGNAGVTVIEKLQKLQNRAAKLVTNSPFDATALPVIRALQWPTVRELIDFESQKIVFRSLKGDAPSYMKDMFTRVNNSTARSLRNAEVDLRLPLLKSAGGQKCFSYRGAKLWNSLGTDAKNSSTLRAFKREVEK